jgi:hypothetical protein
MLALLDETTGHYPRDAQGRIVRRKCPDLNCGGQLFRETQNGHTTWRCDGLTYDRDDGPLVACSYVL